MVPCVVCVVTSPLWGAQRMVLWSWEPDASMSSTDHAHEYTAPTHTQWPQMSPAPRKSSACLEAPDALICHNSLPFLTTISA